MANGRTLDPGGAGALAGARGMGGADTDVFVEGQAESIVDPQPFVPAVQTLVRPGAPAQARQRGLPPLLPGKGLLANILAGALLGAASGVSARGEGAGAVLSGLGSGFTANLGARQQIQRGQQQQQFREAELGLEREKSQIARSKLFIDVFRAEGERAMQIAELGQEGFKADQETFKIFGARIRPLTQQEMQVRATQNKKPFDILLQVGPRDENGIPSKVAFAHSTAKAPATKPLVGKIGKSTIKIPTIGPEEQQFQLFRDQALEAAREARAGSKDATIAAVRFASDFIIQEAARRFGLPVTDTKINAIMQEQQLTQGSPVKQLLENFNIKFSEFDTEVKARARTIGTARQEGTVLPQELREQGQPPRVQPPPEGGVPQQGTTLQGSAVPEVLVLRTVQGQRPDQNTLKRLKGDAGDINLQDATITLPPFLPPDVRRQIQEVLGKEGILIVPQFQQ